MTTLPHATGTILRLDDGALLLFLTGGRYARLDRDGSVVECDSWGRPLSAPLH